MGSLFKSRRAVRTIFFDIGGVVVSAPMSGYMGLGTQFFQCREETLARATAPALGLLEKGLISSEEYWEQLSAAIAASGDGQAIPAWKFKGFWEGLLNDSFQIDQNMIDLVRRLKAHVRVAVLSNVIKEHAMILMEHKVYEHFNPVVLSCKIGMRKPDAEVFQKASELAKTPANRCLLVDDNLENLAAAEKAGYRVYHFQNFEDFRREMFTMGFIDHA